VISAVTASQAVAVAEACAHRAAAGRVLPRLQLRLAGRQDPRRRVRQRVGGRYVEGAVMTIVPPYRIKVPLLLGGPGCRRAGCRCSTPTASRPSSPATAGRGQRHQDVPQRDDQGPGGDGHRKLHHRAPLRRGGRGDRVAARDLSRHRLGKQAAYFFQRVIEHGRRRSEEVREVAETVREAGLTPWSASGTAERQAWVADLADAGLFGARGSPASPAAPTGAWKPTASSRSADHTAKESLR
jgi:hypothetical protein